MALPESKLAPSVIYQGLDLIKPSIDNIIRQNQPVVLLVDGMRGIGKSTFLRELFHFVKQHTQAVLPSRSLRMELNWSLYPRGAKERDLQNPFLTFFRLNDAHLWITQLVEAMQSKQTSIYFSPIYMRSINGTTESRIGTPWTIRRNISYPIPVVFIVGPFSHHPEIAGPFEEITKPVRILVQASPKDQEEFIKMRGRSTLYRSEEADQAITKHDNEGWRLYAAEHQVFQKADFIVQSMPGMVTVAKNDNRMSV